MTDAVRWGRSRDLWISALVPRPRLLKRVFDIDMQHYPNCGAGELKIIAAILEPPVIEKILTHLGLDQQPPPRGRARGRARLRRLSCAGRRGHISVRQNGLRRPAAAGVALRAMSARCDRTQGQP
jgi:hypothetical protein